MVSAASSLTAPAHRHSIDKNVPTRPWIDHLRRRYPTESEIDRVLTRRLRNGTTRRYSPPSLDTLQAAVAALLGDQLEEPFTISDARWLAGGASKLQMVAALAPRSDAVERRRLGDFNTLRDAWPAVTKAMTSRISQGSGCRTGSATIDLVEELL